MRSSIRPGPQNFTALPTRLISTWRSRAASATASSGTVASATVTTEIPFAAAAGPNSAATSASSARGLNGAGRSTSRPASICASSSTSRTRPSSA